MVKKAQRHNHGLNKSTASTNPDRVLKKGTAHARSKDTILRLQMYSKGKGAFRSKELPHAVVEPNRRWFGNTRVVDQQQLEKFREEYNKVKDNPYAYVLRQSKVPYELLKPTVGAEAMAGHFKKNTLLSAESFVDTFGPKRKRKKPKLTEGLDSLEEFCGRLDGCYESYSSEKDPNLTANQDDHGVHEIRKDAMFEKGQSKRIWAELYKVIDSSDVLIQVLDARDPIGTRSRHIEHHLKKDRRHKQLIFVLNKCDLVPTWVTARWVQVLSKEYPTLAFHASMTNSFGKGALIQLLRQFAKLHSDKRQISVGFIGYPNVGKSSVINTLRKKKVCNVAPIPGETKVWQYITLFRRVFLIDCPGVVYDVGDCETNIVLKGVVRVENLKDPTEFIGPLLARVKPDYITRTYGITSWSSPDDFLERYCFATGRLLKGKEPDLKTAAKMILNDWLRGKIPYFTPPPFAADRPEFLEAKEQQQQQQQLCNAKEKAEAEAEEEEAEKEGGEKVRKPQNGADHDDNTTNDESKLSFDPKKIKPSAIPSAVIQEFKNIRVHSEFMEEDIVAPADFDPTDFFKQTSWEELLGKKAAFLSSLPEIDEDYAEDDDPGNIASDVCDPYEQIDDPFCSDSDVDCEEKTPEQPSKTTKPKRLSGLEKSIQTKAEQQEAMETSQIDSEDDDDDDDVPLSFVQLPKANRKKRARSFKGEDVDDEETAFEVVSSSGKKQTVRKSDNSGSGATQKKHHRRKKKLKGSILPPSRG